MEPLSTNWGDLLLSSLSDACLQFVLCCMSYHLSRKAWMVFPPPPTTPTLDPVLLLSVCRLHHQITFKHDEDKVVLAKDANLQGEDTYDIYDPRNPLNKRRRGEGAEGMGGQQGKKPSRGGGGSSRGRTRN